MGLPERYNQTRARCRLRTMCWSRRTRGGADGTQSGNEVLSSPPPALAHQAKRRSDAFALSDRLAAASRTQLYAPSLAFHCGRVHRTARFLRHRRDVDVQRAAVFYLIGRPQP